MDTKNPSKENFTIVKTTFALLFILIPFPTPGQKASICMKHKAETVHEIDIYSAYKDKQTYPLSTISECIEYIPLEKTDKCIIEDIYNPFVTSTDIIVFDFKMCYRFDREGRFLNQIGKVGRGPEEVVRPMGMAVDSLNRWVYLLDTGSERLVKYNYEGIYIKSYKPGFSSMNLLLHKSNIILLGDMNYQYAKPGNRYSIKFFSSETAKVISQMACEKDDDIPFSISFPSMYSYGGETYVKDFWEDIIYRVQDPNNLIAYAAIDNGKFKHRDRDDKSPITGEADPKDKMIMDISFITESDRYIFLASSKGLFCFDKTQNETFCSDAIKDDDQWYYFSNDLNGGPNTKSNSFPRHSVQNNILVTYHHAYEFFDSEGNESPQIKKLKSKISPDDNPVLALIKIKR